MISVMRALIDILVVAGHPVLNGKKRRREKRERKKKEEKKEEEERGGESRVVE